MRWYRKAQADPRMFGEGESSAMFGTPSVQVRGDVLPTVITVPGVEGSININFTLQDVKAALEKTQGGEFFYDVTDIVVEPSSGKFGFVDSQHPHIIHINERAMLEIIAKTIEQEAQKAKAQGIQPQVTPEIEKKVQYEVAMQLASTLVHEHAHAKDFQEELRKIIETGQGSMTSVPESHGPEAEKGLAGHFEWKA